MSTHNICFSGEIKICEYPPSIMFWSLQGVSNKHCLFLHENMLWVPLEVPL